MISLIVTVIVLGVLLWFVEAMIPMPAPFKTLIRVLVVLAVVLYLVRFAGLL